MRTDKYGFGLWLQGEAVTVTTPASLGERNAQQFWEVLAFACTHGHLVAVDMSGTSSCDTRALAPLVMALRYTDTHGVKLRLLLAPFSPIRESLAARGLDSLFPVFDSLPDALAKDHWWLSRRS